MTVSPRPRGGRDNAISRAFSLGSCVPAVLTSQDNALCTNLWTIRVNLLVSGCLAVDDRDCGNVNNRGGTQFCQVAALRSRLLTGPGSLADLTLSDQAGLA